MPHNSGSNGWIPLGGNRDERTGENSCGQGHYSTGVGGLVAIALVLFFLYPALVAVTSPLHPLSSTAIVTIGLVGWITAWLGLELLVEMRRS